MKKTPVFVIVEIILAIIFLFGSWLGVILPHSVIEFFGNCTPPCPPGLNCLMVITYCFDVYLKVLHILSAILLLVYAIYFVVKKYES